MKPAQHRAFVDCLRQHYSISLQRVCRLARLTREAPIHQPKPGRDDGLRNRLGGLVEQCTRSGYLLLQAMAESEGLTMNRKRTYRIYTELGLQVRPIIPMLILRFCLPPVVGWQTHSDLKYSR